METRALRAVELNAAARNNAQARNRQTKRSRWSWSYLIAIAPASLTPSEKAWRMTSAASSALQSASRMPLPVKGSMNAPASPIEITPGTRRLRPYVIGPVPTHSPSITASRRRVRPHCQFEQFLPVSSGFAQRGLGRDEAEVGSVVFDVAHPAVTIAVEEQFADPPHTFDRAQVDFAAEQPRSAEVGRPLRNLIRKYSVAARRVDHHRRGKSLDGFAVGLDLDKNRPVFAVQSRRQMKALPRVNSHLFRAFEQNQVHPRARNADGMSVAVGDPFHRHFDAPPVGGEQRPLIDDLRPGVEHHLAHSQTIEHV